MNDMRNEIPYVAVVMKNDYSTKLNGIFHSMEENGIPYKTFAYENLSNSTIKSPLGLVVHIKRNEVIVFYNGYDTKVPVEYYSFSEDEEKLYTLSRAIGNNIANLIKGRGLKIINEI